ncbi:MAG TPA: CAP domain-containing protein [Phenylobacterium sp.]|uniref:CAP domain-containing protein n=1 Tax=Phenylobacterium sp. TaxID=1871053 RepID=UPI002C9AB955|nr:CAP domain-containing protein [Phenylobacterium sp.]HSV02791.1 CAP domain-containing protein [Phenylobacterium sp.]
MRHLRALLAGICGGLFLCSAPGLAAAQVGVEAAVLDELNFARTHPAQYARELRRSAARGGEVGYSEIGNEDLDALAEAIDFLSRQRPLPPLKPSEGLAAAARAHARMQGRTYLVGHVSPDGATLSERLHAHGVWAGLAAEDISYGYDDPREVVRQLIIDSGVPSRGHRQNIFGAHYQLAGVSCAAHRAWGAMCVIDFAGALAQR